MEETANRCCANCQPDDNVKSIRIAVWERVAPTLESYVKLYQKLNPDKTTTNIIIKSLNLKELQAEASLAQDSNDGFVIPPMVLGSLANILASLDDIDSNDNSINNTMNSQLLPIYKRLQIVDGKRAAIPLFAGNQLLLFYRKDILEQLNQSPPKTWEDVLDISKKLNIPKEPLPINSTILYGTCMGRMSQNACRQRTSQTGMPCHSLSMTYLGMTLSSMTQTDGSSTGWLFDGTLESSQLSPLLNGTLEPTIQILEELLQTGAEDELHQDASLNLDLFEKGRCAMTISANHPLELIANDNVGMVPVPGSQQILHRSSNSLVSCSSSNSSRSSNTTNSINNCPNGIDTVQHHRINQAPFGATDMVVGGISARTSTQIQQSLRAIFQFVHSQTQLEPSADHNQRHQPLTSRDIDRVLEVTGNQEYTKLINSLARHPNTVVPLQIPNAYYFLSDLDDLVYDYLMNQNYTTENRKAVTRNIDDAWNIRIQQHDNRLYATPLAVWHKRSLEVTSTPDQNERLHIGRTMRIIGWSMGAIACTMAVMFGVWVWKYQYEGVVRGSQPLFLWMVCAGAFIMASSIFSFGIEEDILPVGSVSIACMSSVWLYGVGFVMLVSALYSKIWRINRIFRHAHKIRKIKIEKKHIVGPFLLLGGTNIIILLAWTINDHYRWEFETVGDSTMGFCSSDHYKVYLGLLVSINLLVSFYTLIQAYECRKISTEYDESLWVSASLVCIVQVWVICLPILQLIENEPSWSFFTKVCVVFFTCVSTLLCIFVPKICYLRKSWADGGSVDVLSTPLYEEDGEDSEDETSGPFQSAFALIKFGSSDMLGEGNDIHNTSETRHPGGGAIKRMRSSGVIGIRIIRSSGEHGKKIEQLQNNLSQAEVRRRALQDRIEMLQETFEQFIVANHPQGAHAGRLAEARKPSIRALLAGSSRQSKRWNGASTR